MQAAEVAVGMHVRYPRTGTTGKVVRIEKIGGESFAELDSTHLLYRADQLISYEPAAAKAEKRGGGELEQLAREQEATRAAQAQWLSADELCDGGG